jgi:diketogulonate reductase-like aldo/keto reductase
MEVVLSDGRAMPQPGFGVFRVEPGPQTLQAVLAALEAGYRHIDTAAMYGNEESVGEALRRTDVPREEIWITSKLSRNVAGEEAAKAEARATIARLGTVPDLYILHAPWPDRLNLWRGLEALKDAGELKSIGVSNFGSQHIEELMKVARHPPVVNQIEYHPYLQRQDIDDACGKHNIHIEAYSPLAKAAAFGDPELQAVAEKHKVSAAQVMIRWAIQRGYTPLPKSTKPERIKENLSVFQFELGEEDMARLNALGKHELCTGWDPTTWA